MIMMVVMVVVVAVMLVATSDGRCCLCCFSSYSGVVVLVMMVHGWCGVVMALVHTAAAMAISAAIAHKVVVVHDAYFCQVRYVY